MRASTATINRRQQKSKSSSSSPPSNISGGRSLLDYSIVGCFILIIGLVVVLLDTYEYVNVGLHLRGGGAGARDDNDTASSPSKQLNAREEGALMEAMTSSYSTKHEDIEETNREISNAKSILAEKQAEVETVVNHMDDSKVVAGVVASPEVKKIVDEIKEVVIVKESTDTLDQVKEEELIVEAVVEKELGIDQWCGTCIWKDIFKCDHRLIWLMNTYTETEVVIKESLIKDGHCTRKEGGKKD